MKIIAKTISTIFISFFLLSIGNNLFAQNSEEAVVEKLSLKDKDKVAKAEKWLAKGNGILKEASGYDNKAAAMKEAEGKIKMRKINKLEKKSDDLKIKAASYLQDGYRKKAKVFASVIKDSRKTNPQLASRLKEVEFNSDKKIKKSKKLYRKADNMASKSKAVEYLELGHKNCVEAIDILCEGLGVVYDIDDDVQEEIVAKEEIAVVEEEKPEVQESDAGNNRVESSVNSANSTTESVAVVAAEQVLTTDTVPDTVPDTIPDSAPVPVPVPVNVVVEEKPTVDLFFTIQFIADKNPVSQEVLKTKYSGEQEIVEMSAGGWYRYSVGKFTNLNEAKTVMKSEGIKGFIVAYKSGERITVSEAVKILK